MDFGFSPEQEMLRASVRKLLDAECPSALVRQAFAAPTAHVPALWRALADVGALGILVPAEHGGQDGTFLDLVVVLEEAGTWLVPGPFLATVLAGLAVARGGPAAAAGRWLPGIAAGDRRAAVVLATDHRGGADPVDITAEPTGGAGARLRGEVGFAMDADVADLLVVPAHEAAGVSLFALAPGAPGVAIEPHRTADLTRRLCRVRLDATVAAEARIGAAGAARPIVDAVLRHARAALAVEAIGVAQRALDLSVAYANARTQFGRPIGSFQAVKHKCVDMLVGIETARALAYYAAWAVAEEASDADVAVAMAKAHAGEVAVAVTSEAIQVHGGIGFTWEHDLHLYHRRALAIAAAFGGAVDHRETVAAAMLR